MIHHVSVGVSDVARARAFYDPLMALVGLRLLKATERAAHYGDVEVRFSLEAPFDGGPAAPGNGIHVAFRAPSREAVAAFHAAALQNGGTDEGAPGVRAQYDPHYYAAFVRDPDGNKIEAVTYYGR